MLPRLKDIMGRRRRGAVAIMAAVSMIPVTVMFSANLNTSQLIEDRRQTQDAADALAVMHATWTARSLNIMAMNNVTSTQLMSVAIGSEALAGTLDELRFTAWAAIGYIGAHAAKECTPRNKAEAILWAPYCFGQHYGVTIPAQQAIFGYNLFIPWPYTMMHPPRMGANDIDRAFDPDHGVDISHKALRAIEAMNVAIVSRFPRTMSTIGAQYASTNGIDNFHFADPCDGFGVGNCRARNTDYGMALPFERDNGEARAEYCYQMDPDIFPIPLPPLKGTSYQKRGFGMTQRPMSDGGAGGEHLKPYINSKSSIGSVLNRFYRFYSGSRSKTVRRWVYYPTVRHPQFPTNLMSPQNTTRNNSFTRRFDTKEASLCLGINPPLNGLFRLGIEAPVPTFWKLRDIGIVDYFVHPDQMPDSYRILAYGQKRENSKTGTYILGDNVNDSFAYAQATVYNPDGADMFSARWRMELTEATKVENARVAGDKLQQQASTVFGGLATSLRAVSDQQTWGRVNAH